MSKVHDTSKTENLLTFYECIQLLHLTVENGIVARDDNNEQNIIVYCSGNRYNPEGWYSRNLMSVANELVDDGEGQGILLDELKRRNIEFNPTPCSLLENGGLHRKADSKIDLFER